MSKAISDKQKPIRIWTSKEIFEEISRAKTNSKCRSIWIDGKLTEEAKQNLSKKNYFLSIYDFPGHKNFRPRFLIKW